MGVQKLKTYFIFCLSCLLGLFACSKFPFEPDQNSGIIISDDVPSYTFKILNKYPHDPGAFTQGLVVDEGVFFEGTGLRGASSLRKVDLESGEVLQIKEISKSLFGEGIVLYQDKIIQLTWTSNIGFVYNKDTFEKLGQFTYPTQGWGITHDGAELIMSDGSSNLYFLDPETFERTHEISVRYNNRAIRRLNELEYIQDRVFANVWQTDSIAVINPENGLVTNWLDLTRLLQPEDRDGRRVDVLNGIAYDEKNSKLYVTGKLWPTVYQIGLIPRE